MGFFDSILNWLRRYHFVFPQNFLVLELWDFILFIDPVCLVAGKKLGISLLSYLGFVGISLLNEGIVGE